MNKIIAVDFDGTLCENKYPEIGEPKIDVIQRLLTEKEQGARIILWTCRQNQFLNDAIDWCRQQGIEFDCINSNLQECIDLWGNDCRKISAHEYWDDRAITIK